MRLRALAATSVLAAGLVMLPTAPAWAGCANVGMGDLKPAELPKDDSGNWVLSRFGLNRLPTGLDGRGVTVAVLDSGVQSSHPALSGRLTSNGRDFLSSGGGVPGGEDCRGHGTAVASLIAGKPRDGFRGIAPGAKIMPIRVNETIGGDTEDGRKTDDTKIAAAIDWAVDHGADVINLSFAYLNGDAEPEKHAVFAAAVRRAVEKDVVVVAAVGNDEKATDSFPANLPDVIGVAAIRDDGVLWGNSTHGAFVDISAPGGGKEGVLVAWPGGGYTQHAGTSFATPIVAGTAALLKQLHPDWKAAQFARQLTATADPSPGGKNSKEYGAGVVNPVRAVSEVPGFGTAFKNPDAAVAAPDPVVVAAEERAAVRHTRALWLALGAIALTVIVLLSSSILHNGGRRHWRPAE
ncbi:MAG: type VII secretion-associated serine protease mycosin [Hamadaea sp.]|nr:type VII secretion-associated serine protease mycosin [Hamadaea sp.]